jgi:hypothetical protein
LNTNQKNDGNAQIVGEEVAQVVLESLNSNVQFGKAKFSGVKEFRPRMIALRKPRSRALGIECAWSSWIVTIWVLAAGK